MKGGDQKLGLPAGFRFHPTDEELVMHYLCPKCAEQPIVVPIIAEIDLYKFDPWQLPGMALYGEKEWYFFSPRDRKYPNGSRPNRAAGRGYWKATGADKPVGKPKTMGIKKALVFYSGKAPRGLKTNWIMHEYRLANVDRSAANNKNNSRLDDWVLCRIYNKKGIIEKHHIADHQESIKYMEDEEQKPKIISTIAQVFSTMPPQSLPNSNSRSMASQVMNEYLHFDTCHESVPRLHTDESSGSEQVLSPEFTSCDKEVQSVPKWNDFDIRDLDYDHQLNYMDGFQDDDPFGSQMQYSNQLFPLQDMFVCMQKPFKWDQLD